MFANFDELCKKLGINSSTPSAEDLGKLVHWCETTVSTDRHFEGRVKERFASYRDFASDILVNVLPNIQTNKLTDPLPALKGMTSLQYIVDKGLDIYLKKLKPSAIQTNSKVKNFTLLQFAAASGNLHTVETLLALGADPTKQITLDASILFNALAVPIVYDEAMKQHKEAIYVLLQQYCKNTFQQRNETGDSILHIMAIYGYSKLVQDMLTKTKELVTIANNFMHYPIHSAILNGQYECVKLLLVVDNIEQLTDAKGRNALHYAAKYGDEEMVKICLSSSLSKNSIDKQNQTPLILAIRAHNFAAVKELLNFGVSINDTDNSGKSVLHYAVESNDEKVVKLLLASKSIEVNIKDSASHHPLDLIQAHTPEGAAIKKLLIAKGATKGLTGNRR